MQSAFTWCAALHNVLEHAQLESDVIQKYRHAFRFMKGMWVNKPTGSDAIPVVTNRPFCGFVSGDVKLDGLTSELARVFHPLPLNVSTGGAATGGSARGMRVDRELAQIVNTGNIPAKIHAYTAKTINELVRNNLRPFACQVPVGSPLLRLATSLDIMCVDEADGGLVNVQLKTGFERNYEKTDGMFFQAPFHKDEALMRTEDTHRNRHLLQLCAEHLIVQTAYNNPLAYSVLMVISQERHQIYKMGHGGEDTTRNISPAGVFMNLKKRSAGDELLREIDALRKKHAVKAIMKKRHRLHK